MATNNKWSQWASLGKPETANLGNPFVHRNQDGRLEVFAVEAGALFNIWQLFPNAGWKESRAEKGKPFPNIGIKSLVAGSNQDGRQEVFALGEDNALWHIWQVAPNNGWSHWQRLGSPSATTVLTGKLTVGRNQDGRQELFALGTDGNIWQIWQTAPNNGWSQWKNLGQPDAGIRPSDRITVGRNEDGRQELFVMGGDEAVWHIWQVAPNVGWSDWESLGKPRDLFDGSEPPKDRDLSEPLVQSNAKAVSFAYSHGKGSSHQFTRRRGSTGWPERAD